MSKATKSISYISYSMPEDEEMKSKELFLLSCEIWLYGRKTLGFFLLTLTFIELAKKVHQPNKMEMTLVATCD